MLGRYAWLMTDRIMTVLRLRSTGPGYIGTVLQLETAKPPQTDFNFLTMTAGGNQVFFVRGDGHTIMPEVTITGGLTVAGSASFGALELKGSGFTIDNGGLAVNDGNIAINNGNLLLDGRGVFSHDDDVPVVTISSTRTVGDEFTSSVLTVDAVDTGTNMNILTLSAGGTDYFRVRGDGKVLVEQGGMTIEQAGLVVEDVGVTIAPGGLVVDSDRTTVAAIAARATAPAGFTGNVLQTTATQAPSSSFNLFSASSNDGATPIFSVRGDGFTVVEAGGMRVSAGGLTVEAGNLVSDTTVIITAGGLQVQAGGVTIADDGLVVQEGGMYGRTLSTTAPILTLETLSGNYEGHMIKLIQNQGPVNNMNLLQTVTSANLMLQVGTDGHFLMRAITASNARPRLNLQRARYDGTNEASVVNGDVLYDVRFSGWTGGTDVVDSASIRAEVDESVIGVSRLGSKLVFASANDGANAPTTRLVLNKDGRSDFYDTTGSARVAVVPGAQQVTAPSGTLEVVAPSVTAHASTGTLLLSANGQLTAESATSSVDITAATTGSFESSSTLSLHTATGTSTSRAALYSGAASAGTSGNVLVYTGSAAGDAAGTLSLYAGATDETAGKVVIDGGDATTRVGGDVVVTGGGSTGSTGGRVVIQGGSGTGGLGHVVLQGEGASYEYFHGTSSQVDVEGPILNLQAQTNLDVKSMTAPAGADSGDVRITTGDFTTAGFSAGRLVLSTGASDNAAGGVVSIAAGPTNDGRGGSVNILAGATTDSAGGNAGGEIVLTGGTTAKGVGGAVSLTGGTGTDGTGGDIVLAGGSGSDEVGQIRLRNVLDNYDYVVLGGTSTTVQAATPSFVSREGTDLTIRTSIDGGSGDTGNLMLSTGTPSVGSDAGYIMLSTSKSATAGGGAISLLGGGTINGQPGSIVLSVAATDQATANGGNIDLTAGASPTSGTGAGGAVRITAGVGAGSPGRGGAIEITSGANTVGPAGPVLITGATGGETGGSISIRAGTGTPNGAVVVRDATDTRTHMRITDTAMELTGRNMVMQGVEGEDVTITSTHLGGADSSGDLILSTGTVTGIGDAGDIHLFTGDTFNRGGDITLSIGTASNAVGSGILLTAGDTTVATLAGGDIQLHGGSALVDGVGEGGDVTLTGGDANGATAGHVVLQGGNAIGSNAQQGGDVILLPGEGIPGGSQHGNLYLRHVDQSFNYVHGSATKTQISHDTLVEIRPVETGRVSITTSVSSDPSPSGGISISTADGLNDYAGDIAILAGKSTISNVQGGHVSIVAGSATDVTGGNIRLEAGSTTNSHPAGVLTIVGGSVGTGSDAGGTVSITGGVSQDGVGGPVAITGGIPRNGVAKGGTVSIFGGAGDGTVGLGGDVAIRGGDANTPGAVKLLAGDETPSLTVHGSGVVEASAISHMLVHSMQTITGRVVAVPDGGLRECDCEAGYVCMLAVTPATNLVRISGNPVDGQTLVVVNQDDQPTTLVWSQSVGSVVVGAERVAFLVFYGVRWYGTPV